MTAPAGVGGGAGMDGGGDGGDGQDHTSRPPGAVAPQRPTYGPLLDEEDPEKVAKMVIDDLWDVNPRWHKRQAAEWMRNKMLRNGDRFVRIVEDPDYQEIRLATPVGQDLLPPVPNMVDVLIRQGVAMLIADPPRPECEPTERTPDAIDAAAAATELLEVAATESGLNTDLIFETACDLSGTYGTGFVEWCYDPHGGGIEPQQIQAHPMATTVEEAETGPPGATPAEPVLRYLRPDGTLSKSGVGAEQVRVPKLVPKFLTGNHLRFLPRSCNGLSDCHGVVIGDFTTLGDLQSQYADEMDKLSNDDLWKLAEWRPKDWKRLQPDDCEYKRPDRSKEHPDDPPPPSTPIATLKAIYRSGSEYPYGAYVVVCDKWVLRKTPWVGSVPDGKGQLRQEALDIPVSGMTWIRTPGCGNPYGEAPPKKLGPLDELRAGIYASVAEYLWRFSRPRPYLPLGTIVQPEDLADPERPIYFNPQGEPKFPQLPQYPDISIPMADRLEAEMKAIIGIRDASMGIAAGSVRSADQQRQIIDQANMSLASFRASAEDFYERLHRTYLQMARAFLTQPQLMRVQGRDGGYRMESFNRMALGDTSVVRVRRGTMTMTAPLAKAEQIGLHVQSGALTPVEAARLTRDNIGILLGLREQPAITRIKRQIALWRRGPSEDVAGLQPEPQIDPGTGEPAMDQNGQPVLIDPVAQAAEACFPPMAVDDEPAVAQLRHQELVDALSDADTLGFPAGWVSGLQNVYLRTRQAAGVQTIAEQQQAQQASAQQEAEREQQERNAERVDRQQEKAADRAVRMEEREQDRAVKREELAARQATLMRG